MTRRIPFVLVLVAAAMAVPASTASAAGGDVTVMSRNIYLGADIIGLATAPDLAAFKVNAEAMYGVVKATNFPARAVGLAAEIKAKKPDLVGLQEAATWSSGTAGDPAAATKVDYDFTKLLLAALKKQGMKYTVVVDQVEFDFEAPTVTQDVRLTMHDVILKRTGSKVKTGKTSKSRYKVITEIPTAAGLAKVYRGWTAVDASIGGRTFKFVNTHLEAYGAGIRESQAKELFAAGGPLSSKTKPAILLGDLNSDPTSGDAEADAYKVFTGAGMKDVYGTKRVQTFGMDEKLIDPKPTSNVWIDHILYSPSKNFSVRSKGIVGTKPFRKVAPLWASDHMGVVAKLRVK
ncbi:MAG: endonuclease/exonuclease/phosphatase family protein [Solirubrobacteraceae bacterium]|nr:endonuclease/exonuclease/phosphatase family protein [Solirubrobacteraceae bacterium]MDP4673446.1 endonuclease/exonuclease/phosphatase family protein [Solirubrobacteraceae bacterium]MDP4921243.1 endonuclease/exonuclease/phosphatase family protein [Solirubrobacteraceae bacterium]